MKVTITYANTGKVETREIHEATFVNGRLMVAGDTRFSNFFLFDLVTVKIEDSHKACPACESGIDIMHNEDCQARFKSAEDRVIKNMKQLCSDVERIMRSK
jgi:hypothetical protein